MSYDLTFSLLSLKKLKRLEKKEGSQILQKLERAADSPARLLEPLRSIDAYKIRAGAYRIIVECDHEHETLFVMTLGHRSTVYKEIQRFKKRKTQ